MRRATILLGLWILGCNLPVVAATVYRCTAHGRVSYQDTPCTHDQRQQRLALPSLPTIAAPVASNTAPPAPAHDATVPAPVPPAPTVPLRAMYTCVRATDGKHYLSRNGSPAPYLVPFGMLGAMSQSLSDVYGPTHGAAGISAPEANRGRVTPGLIASNYVQVRDSCRELSRAETCQALNDAYEENTHKLEHAFKSDRAPLEKRDADLQAQLTNC